MDKQLKALLNSLRCPVCKSQIDIYGGRIYSYCCAKNNLEYMLHIPFAAITLTPVIAYDKVKIFDDDKKYIVDQQYETKTTVFDIWSVDAEGNVKDYNNKTVKLDYILFDYQKTDRERIIR